ncbi:hypothetical protein CMV_026178 [Castanea mollissima]|uniref:Uncharacterized protein n=1 Tax=Castanea mollissima TaxID=60419 RepID=A0A8J4QMJ8_9ROSI|nr:hypothetical protein CMV_026178 [Castanea mollissima]
MIFIIVSKPVEEQDQATNSPRNQLTKDSVRTLGNIMHSSLLCTIDNFKCWAKLCILHGWLLRLPQLRTSSMLGVCFMF